MLFIISINALNRYAGFGFTGGLPGSKINNNALNPIFPNGRIKDSHIWPEIATSFEQLDPGYIANKVNNNDSMISRENFLTVPVPDPIREKILAKSDSNESLPFDYTQGFIPAPNDTGMTYSSENLAKSQRAPVFKQGYTEPKQAQALVMDPFDPTNNVIVDLPPGSDYYPANNPYVIVKSDGPIKLRKRAQRNNRSREDSDSSSD